MGIRTGRVLEFGSFFDLKLYPQSSMQQRTTVAHGRKAYLVIAIGSFAIAIALLIGKLFEGYFSGIHNLARAYSIPFALLGLIICMGVFFYGYRQGRIDLFEIVYPLSALYMLHYPIRALFMLGFPNLTRYLYRFPVNSEIYLSHALLLFDIGFLAFVCGYFWSGGRDLAATIPKIPWIGNISGLFWKGVLVYGAGFAAFLILLASGSALRFQWVEGSRNTSFYNSLVFLSELRVVGLYLTWVAYLNQKKPNLFIPYLIVLIELLVGVAAGSKQALFQMMIALLFAYHYTNHRITAKAVLLLGTFLLVLFPLVQTYRDIYRHVLGFRPDPHLTEIYELRDDVSLSFSSELSFIGTVQQIMNRANQLDYLTTIVYRVPDYIDHQNTLWPTIISGFIPRMLWPDKPTLALGRYMVSVVLGSASRTNAPVTNIGEFYLNFGVMGVPIGMFILGAVYRIVYTYLHLVTTSRLLTGMIYLWVFPSMLFLSTGLAAFPVSLARTMLVVLVILWLFFRTAENRQLSGIGA